MKKKFLLSLLLLAGFCLSLNAQQVKIACWNLLNYPNSSSPAADTTLRHPFYRSVISHINPDILVTEEMTSATGATWLLDDVLNSSGAAYNRGTFINGFDTDNAIYFKASSFSFVSNLPIETDLRDISEFTLVHLSTGDTLRIYAVHLKASNGSTNEAQRALEVDSLRAVTNRFASGKNFIVCGDFNIYGTSESAYQKLLLDNTGDDGNFVDPLNMPGTWNSPSYSSFHTQSTRTTSFGGGATGGMNDRFDMILFSTAVSQGLSGMSYVPASTVPIGNDGSHYNMSINVLPNSAAPTSVLDALHNASDHLPVVARFQFFNPSGLVKTPLPFVHFYPNPAGNLIFLESSTPPESIEIFNIAGKACMSSRPYKSGAGWSVNVATLAPGMYAARVRFPEGIVAFRFVKD